MYDSNSPKEILGHAPGLINTIDETAATEKYGEQQDKTTVHFSNFHVIS